MFSDISEASKWLAQRFLPNIVWIDEFGYTQMCIDALKILHLAAATDYGSSRQRDLGQHWADMTRGYLAEYAFIKFLEKKWGISAQLGHEVGQLADYLPRDIHQIKKTTDTKWRSPNISIGIKGTKWNGIWLDIPGAQFDHSDIHVMVKVGVGRDHLFAYFKHISVFRDKILPQGIASGMLSEDDADFLFSALPDFAPIPAYITGFVSRESEFKNLPYTGKLGKKHYTIKTWNGEINPDDLDTIRELEEVPGDVKFEGIGRFSHNKGYLFNTGNLTWEKSKWEKFVIDHL